MFTLCNSCLLATNHIDYQIFVAMGHNFDLTIDEYDFVFDLGEMDSPERSFELVRQTKSIVKDFPLKKITAKQRASGLNCTVCLDDFVQNPWARELTCKVDAANNLSAFIL